MKDRRSLLIDNYKPMSKNYEEDFSEENNFSNNELDSIKEDCVNNEKIFNIEADSTDNKDISDIILNYTDSIEIPDIKLDFNEDFDFNSIDTFFNMDDSYEIDNFYDSISNNSNTNNTSLNTTELKEDNAKELENKVTSINDNQKVSSSKNRMNKKSAKLNPKLYINIISAIGIGISSFVGLEIGSQIREEHERLEDINLKNINLQLIVDTTDNVGGSNYQLNWKEILAVVGVLKNNYTDTIQKKDIEDVANLFINNKDKKVKSFDDVISSLDLTPTKLERAYNYLIDLEHYGFIPERLSPDGEQVKFINSIKDYAIENYHSSKILPSITIAQAILESNWGKSSLTTEANNLFGIKADSSWTGEFAIFDTKEYHDIYIQDKFRKYNSVEESIKDHSAFLLQHERYKNANVFNAKTYKDQALALENAGYSTAQDENGNKTYAKMLGELIRQYNLQIIDSKVINNK